MPLENGGGGTGYSPGCLASTEGGAGGRVFSSAAKDGARKLHAASAAAGRSSLAVLYHVVVYMLSIVASCENGSQAA